MGSTYNWNALQASGIDPALGFDPLAPSSPFGVTEFFVSAGSKIVNESSYPTPSWESGPCRSRQAG